MSKINLRASRRILVGISAVLLASLVPEVAAACGGLFCSNATPVNQVAERIIFSKNAGGTVSAVIEVQYAGPAHEFAWVLPVPAGEVDVGVGSTDSLDQLQQQSNPVYTLQRQVDEDCFNGAGGAFSAAGGASSGGAGPFAAGGAGGAGSVEVVASSTVGPYDYAQLAVSADAADPAEAAVSWLEMNEYDVSGVGKELLAEYLEDGMNLLAFKLSKGNSSGSIRPVLLTYAGSEPMIPIKPTAVAANDNMGVMVWVLGESRAAPINYRHLELNEAYINWFNPGPTYNAVVSAAADEAGGQGFITEQAGSTAAFAEALYPTFQQQQWEHLSTGRFTTIPEFIQTAVQSYGNTEGFLEAMSAEGVLPLREGATPEQFLRCPECYFEVDVVVRNDSYPSTPYVAETDPMNDFDAGLVLTSLDRLVVGPMRKMRGLFEGAAWVTRFYTTLSPEEMTKDPIFSFNSDLPAFSNFHTAVQRVHCSGDFGWHVDLPQGGSVAGSGAAWPFTTNGETEMPVNLRVLQLTESSQKLITDATKEVLTILAQQSGEPGSATEPAIEAEPANQDEPDAEVPGAEVPGAKAEAPDGGGSKGGARGVEAEHTGVASEATASGCSVAPGAKNLPALALLSGLGLLFGFWRRRT